MNVLQALELADNLVAAKTARHLSDLQRLLLEEFWGKPSLRYDELAQSHGYSASYLKQDAGPKLWLLLSDACGEKVSKANFRAALERKWSVVSQNENHSLVGNLDDVSLPITVAANRAIAPFSNNYQDWGDAPDVSAFYNRYDEIAQLKQWIVDDRCRLVAIAGMGGIGKTYISIKLAEQIQDRFEYTIWRSLRNAPPLQQILTNILQAIANSQETDLAATVDDKISYSIEFFPQTPLLVNFR